jgi:hypothetical protein
MDVLSRLESSAAEKIQAGEGMGGGLRCGLGSRRGGPQPGEESGEGKWLPRLPPLEQPETQLSNEGDASGAARKWNKYDIAVENGASWPKNNAGVAMINRFAGQQIDLTIDSPPASDPGRSIREFRAASSVEGLR